MLKIEGIKRVAITGSIASGKSTVCQRFEQLGAYVVSADTLLHQAFSSTTSIGKQIHRLFGDEIIEGTSVNRSKIAHLVMNSPGLLDQMEAICHPYVIDTIQSSYDAVCQKGIYTLFVAEVPLLFEKTLSKWFDATIVVVSKRQKELKRYIHKGGNREQFTFFLSRQWPTKEKMNQADFILFNNQTLTALEKRASHLFNFLITKTT